MNRPAMIEALKLSEDKIRAVRQELEEQERKFLWEQYKIKELKA